MISGLEAIATAWGVTPQAQNTGTSPSLISLLSPKSGLSTSLIPITDGSPIWTGAPWVAGNLAVTVVALTISL